MSVCKVTFGAEPKDYEVLEFILSQYYKLKLSPAVEVEVRKNISTVFGRETGLLEDLTYYTEFSGKQFQYVDICEV